jgi:hypothetical protein
MQMRARIAAGSRLLDRCDHPLVKPCRIYTCRMLRKRSPGVGVDRLVADLTTDAFGDELGMWLAGLPRFRAFTEAHRDKIRKKLRLPADADALLDVRAELLVARLLLADRNVELAFEPGGATRGGPDFAVSYRRAHAFSLEVTRPRRPDASRPILAKLRQLPTGGANVLLLAVPAASAPSWDVSAAVRAIRARADAKEEDFFRRRDFAGTRDFYDRFLRLGAVITWSEPTENPGRADAWVNGSARNPVPKRPLRACLAALAAVGTGG